MKTDSQLQSDVIAELKWDDSVNANKIHVDASDGVVTLSGHVDSYSQKWSAERAAHKVCGVKALVVDIVVVVQGAIHRSDAEISNIAENILAWTASLPKKKVNVIVKSGWVTVSGLLDYEYQRELVSSAIRNLVGVTGFSDQIKVKKALTTNNVKTNIQAALKRRALTDTEEINVVVHGGKVTLTGIVQSWSERDMVSDSVWHTHGVTEVTDNISVA